MVDTHQARTPELWSLSNLTAADLMHPNPVSIRNSASVEEATAFLAEKGFSAAPVIDEAGHAIGVISVTDILVHERELALQNMYPPVIPDSSDHQESLPGEYEPSITRVSDLMTPTVLSVPEDATADAVLIQMVDQKVHHLFVVDHTGVLVGVISSRDLLAHLRA